MGCNSHPARPHLNELAFFFRSDRLSSVLVITTNSLKRSLNGIMRGVCGYITLEPKAWFRRHDDRFSYIYNSKHYANRHTTDAAGGELRLKKKLGAALDKADCRRAVGGE